MRPKPKSAGELFKEWGGVLSLMIALLYSFPLGVWDRFVVTPEQRRASELAEVRDVISQSTQMQIDFARTITGIQDPELRDLAISASNTRLFILMEKNSEALARRIPDLSFSELVVLGYNYAGTGLPGRAVEVYQAAVTKAKDNAFQKATALRLIGMTLFQPSATPDLRNARKYFEEAIGLARQLPTLDGRGLEIDILSVWGRAELLSGDWTCGTTKTNEAIALLTKHRATLGQAGANRLALLMQLSQTVQRQPNQPALGC